MSEDTNLEPRPHSFGPQEVDSVYLYVQFFSYFYFTNSVNLWLPYGLAFYFKHFNPSTISSHCLHFAFLVKTGEGRLPLLKISSFPNPPPPPALCSIHNECIPKGGFGLYNILRCAYNSQYKLWISINELLVRFKHDSVTIFPRHVHNGKFKK